MSRTPFVSEVPVRCELLRTENGGWVLERRLDPGFARLPAAREAFLEEIAAAAAQKGGASGLAVVLEASGGSEPRLAREYRPEGTLRDLLRAGPPPEETAIGIVSAIADALDALHGLGLVHGDPCPENVLLRTEGGIAVADACSSRRALGLVAGGTRPSASPRADWDALLTLARRLFSPDGTRSSGGLRREALSILDGAWEAERKVAALQRLAPPDPVRVSVPSSTPSPEIPFPLPVSVAVTAPPEPRVRFAVAKICATASGLTPGHAARLLEAGNLSFGSVHPSPALAVVADLNAAGAKASLWIPGRGPAPARTPEE